MKHLIGLASDHTRVYYITGNHDEFFRKFSGMKLGKLKIVNELRLTLQGNKVWFFHGDVFDVVMQNSKWLAILGAIGYNALIWINTRINLINRILGFEPVSLSKKIKQSIKGAVRYINSFEETAARIAVRKGFNTMVCGHIHHPEMRTVDSGNSSITYLNSGDWVENLTSLEYHENNWRIYNFHKDYKYNIQQENAEKEILIDTEPKQHLKALLKEFQN